MRTPPTLSDRSRQALRCPACLSTLTRETDFYQCTNTACAGRYPTRADIPILIHEANSVFSIADFTQERNTFFALKPSRAARLLNRITPSISANYVAEANYARLAGLLLEQAAEPAVLVLGGSIVGSGMAPLLAQPAIELIESDISFGPRTALICDGHDIPFATGSLDAVVAQAVLEHVVDPHRVVAEIHRVLKPNGLVYAETPFMQQMHGGRYDFERFSYWGHRRLFRHFIEVDSGIACGPGMALAWSYTYFLRSLARSKRMRQALQLFGSLTSFWLRFFDKALIRRPEAIPAASGYYFMGRKSDTVLADRELIATYRTGR